MKLPIIRPVILTILRIFSWGVYLLTIASAYGGRVNPELSTMPAVLTLIFPWLTILTVILTLFWTCYSKILSAALGVITILFCLDPLSNAFPVSFPNKAGQEQTTFTLTTFNCLHFEDSRNPDYPGNRAIEFLLKEKSDLVCLQEMINLDNRSEIIAPENLIDSLKQLYPWRIGNKGNDLKLFSRYPAILQFIYPYSKGSINPFEFYTVKIKGHRLNIVNVHLASYFLSTEERHIVTDIHSVESARHSISEFKGTVKDKLGNSFRYRARQAALLRDMLDRLPDPVIICGDFNDVPESWAYRTIKGDDFHDAYSETGFGHLITYNTHLFYFHIDQILYRGPLKALKVEKGDLNSSDHYPLTVTFAFTDNTNNN